jgi:hypothetical protein
VVEFQQREIKNVAYGIILPKCALFDFLAMGPSYLDHLSIVWVVLSKLDDAILVNLLLVISFLFFNSDRLNNFRSWGRPNVSNPDDAA